MDTAYPQGLFNWELTKQMMPLQEMQLIKERNRETWGLSKPLHVAAACCDRHISHAISLCDRPACEPRLCVPRSTAQPHNEACLSACTC